MSVTEAQKAEIGVLKGSGQEHTDRMPGTRAVWAEALDKCDLKAAKQIKRQPGCLHVILLWGNELLWPHTKHFTDSFYFDSDTNWCLLAVLHRQTHHGE